MAKQSVSFVERHLEKIVIGVAGLVTLSVAALYVITSPNSVESGGTSIGPGELGPRLKSDAKSLYESVKKARAKPSPLPDYVAEVQRSKPSEIDRGLTPRLSVALTPLNPLPPPVKQIDISGKSRLAKILPPGKPVVFQGRNRATLSDASTLPGLDLRGPSAATPAVADASSLKDLSWVTVAAPVFRSKQIEEYSAAGYVPTRNAILITRVRLERQHLLPDDTWSEPPDEVPTYAKYSPVTPPEVRVIRDDAGAWDLDADSRKALESLATALGTAREGQFAKERETQAAIWRAPLAPYLDMREWPPADAPKIDDVEWQVWPDRETPGSQFKGPALTGGTPTQPPPRERRPPPRDTARSPARPPTADAKPPPAPRKTTPTPEERARGPSGAREKLKDADRAYKEGDLETASKLLIEILDEESRAPKDVRNKADELKKQVDAASDAEKEKVAKIQEQIAARDKGQEADVEPIWAHDLTAEPGRTYRYRLRIEVFNQYSLAPKDLADPRDAEKVLLAGDWSEWSDPVTVEPDTHFFFTDVSRDGINGPVTSATVSVYKWADGEWHDLGKKRFEIGQQIACDDRKAGHVDARMTIMDIDADVKRAVRTRANPKDGSFDIAPPASSVQLLLLADADGRMWERIAQEDRIALADMQKDLKEKASSHEGTRESPRMPLRPGPEPSRLGPLRSER